MSSSFLKQETALGTCLGAQGRFKTTKTEKRIEFAYLFSKRLEKLSPWVRFHEFLFNRDVVFL